MVSGNWFTYFSGTSSTVGSVDSKQTINPETEPTTTTGTRTTTHVTSRTTTRATSPTSQKSESLRVTSDLPSTTTAIAIRKELK